MADFPDLPDLDYDRDDDGATRTQDVGRRSAGQHTPLLPPVSTPRPASRGVSPAGETPNTAGRGLLSNTRRAAIDLPDRPPEFGDETEDEASNPARSAPRGFERFEEHVEDARTALVSALGTAGHRVRTAVPQSERVFAAGQSLGARLGTRLAPFFAWLARLFHPFWSFIHRRMFKSRRRAGLSATLVVIAVLLATILPPLVTLANALNDYTSLKTLGEDGLHHLLAAKDDLTGSSSSSTSGSSNPSGSSSSLTAAGDALDQLNSFFLPQPDATAAAPYRYLAQRQSGTDNAVTVTVHPAPGMTKAGLGQQTYTATLDTSDLFAYGLPQAAATPAPGSNPAPSTNAASGSGTQASDTSSSSKRVDLQAAVADLRAANKDFAELRSKLNSPDWILNAAGTLPGTKTSLTTVRALADVGYDITSMGLELVNALDPVLQRAESGALSGTGDLVTPADLDALQHAMEDADSYLTDIENRLPVVDISQLPITPDQAATFAAAIELLPKVHDSVRLLIPWVKPLGWAIGVGGTRNYLVQTLDKAELRATGGFTGNYGVLSISNGKLAPFTLYNINDIEYGYKNNGYIYGRKPPQQFSWWPFPNFGLRDSNVSADFPTTAKLNIDLFKAAGQGNVDGVIQFTTTVIANVLRVTGPIYVPNFNETVTADNLEQKIHFYEEDPAGIAIQQKLFPNDHTFSLRKRFTQAVTSLLQEKVKHLPTSQLLPMAKQIFSDMQSKDLQIYVTNAQIEDQLLKLNVGGAIDTRSDIDGLLMVQSNVSVSKDSPYVHVAQSDDVTLDDKGGATHRFTATFYNNPAGPIYGYSTYLDYLRIYVPPQARLIRGTGFDTMLPLCWTPPPGSGAGEPGKFAQVPYCPDNPYPDGELTCPAGQYGPGSLPYSTYSDGNTNWTLDVRGPPPQTVSDMPGRGMWGGYVVIPSHCTAKITLRWYVPHTAYGG